MTHEKQQNTTTIVIALLALNLLLLLYVGFFKKDAVWLETMKVGGAENMMLVQKLYNSDTYKTQQTQAIEQVLGSLNNPSAQGGNAQQQAQGNPQQQAPTVQVQPSAPAAK